MRYHKILMASLFGLFLIGINAWADDAPVVDLNTLPDDSISLSESPASVGQSSVPDSTAARQSLPMSERVRLLEQQLNNLTQMNLLGKIDSLEQQVNQLNGQIEEQNHLILQLKTLQKQPEQDLNNTQSANIAPAVKAKQPIDASQLADKTAVNKPLSSAPVASPKNDAPISASNPIIIAETAVVQNKSAAKNVDKSATTGGVSDEKAYQAAFDLMVKKKNTAAIAGFKAFLKNYPNTDYAPSAHYWLGELYAAGNMAALASKEFNTVIQKYPTHAKVPDAMLKLAIIHDDAGEHAQAKQEFQKVIKQFPNSTAAKLAKMRLK